MIREIVMTPWELLKAYWKTVVSLPGEFREWRQKIAQQSPVVFDHALYEATGSSIDPNKLYVTPIAYKLVFFWLFFSGGGQEEGSSDDESTGKTDKPRRVKPKPATGINGFFEAYKLENIIGTVWEFRLGDDYNFFTQRWLGLFGEKPRSFNLWQVVGGVSIAPIPNSLDAANIGLLTLKVQLGSDAYMTIYVPVRGQGSYWRDQFNEYHGVAAVAAMLEEAIKKSRELHAAKLEAWKIQRVGL